MQFLKWLFDLPIQIALSIIRLPKRFFRWSLIKAITYFSKHPGLKIWAMARLQKYPNLETKLRRLARGPSPMAAQPGQSTISAPLKAVSACDENTDLVADLSSLTPRARSIYGKLEIALKKNQKDHY